MILIYKVASCQGEDLTEGFVGVDTEGDHEFLILGAEIVKMATLGACVAIEYICTDADIWSHADDVPSLDNLVHVSKMADNFAK